MNVSYPIPFSLLRVHRLSCTLECSITERLKEKKFFRGKTLWEFLIELTFCT